MHAIQMVLPSAPLQQRVFIENPLNAVLAVDAHADYPEVRLVRDEDLAQRSAVGHVIIRLVVFPQSLEQAPDVVPCSPSNVRVRVEQVEAYSHKRSPTSRDADESVVRRDSVWELSRSRKHKTLAWNCVKPSTYDWSITVPSCEVSW